MQDLTVLYLLLIMRKHFPSIPALYILYHKAFLFTQSNAFLNSANVQYKRLFLFKNDRKTVCNINIASVVERLSTNANCASDITLY